VSPRDHRRNTTLLATVEVGWGLSYVFIHAEAVIPVLLQNLGASYALVALLPAATYAVSFPFELLSPYATEGLPRKRGILYASRSIVPLLWAVLGAWLLLGDTRPASRAVSIFYALFLASSALQGFVSPLGYDYLGKVTDPKRWGSAFSTIFALQSLAGVLGAWLAQKLLDAGLAGQADYGLCFLAAAIAAQLANQALLWTRETPGDPSPPRVKVREYLGDMARLFREDRALRRYVYARGVTRLAPVVMTFYSIQAKHHFPGTPIALLGAILLGGKLAASLATWRWSDGIGMKPFIVLGFVALGVAGFLLAACEEIGHEGLRAAPYFVAAFLVGVYQVADTSANSTFVMELAPEGRRARYLIAVNALLVPLSAGLPYAAGALADRIGPAPVQFATAIVFAFAAAYVALAVPERRRGRRRLAPRRRERAILAAGEAGSVAGRPGDR
jgi:MFS family permease